MAKITKEQVNKINSGLENGFVFDLRHFLIWGEKRVHKFIELEDGKKLECVIDYRDYTRWNTPKDLRIEITTSIWNPTTSGCYSCATGYRHSLISDGHTKKMFKKLQEATKEITDDIIFAVDNGGEREMENGFVF